MDWLKDLIKKNPFSALMLPTSLGAVTFFANLFAALSDWDIDSDELHELMSSASGFETLLLIVIMFALKQKKK